MKAFQGVTERSMKFPTAKGFLLTQLTEHAGDSSGLLSVWLRGFWLGRGGDVKIAWGVVGWRRVCKGQVCLSFFATQEVDETLGVVCCRW